MSQQVRSALSASISEACREFWRARGEEPPGVSFEDQVRGGASAGSQRKKKLKRSRADSLADAIARELEQGWQDAV